MVEKDDILFSLRSWGKGLVSSPPAEIGALLRLVRQRRKSPEGLRDLDGRLREVGFAIVAGVFEGIAESVLERGYEGAVREAGGERERFVGHRQKTYRAVIGLVPVRRAAYQGSGAPHFPLDETLGVNGWGWTKRLETMAVHAGVEHDFREGERCLALAGVPLSDTTLRRACNCAGAAVREQEDRERADSGPRPRAVRRALAVEADGFLVFTEEGWKEIRAGLVRRIPRGEAPERLVEKTYVATFHERERFWAMLETRARARGWRAPGDRLFLSDGSRLLQDDGEAVFADAHSILDFYHAVEHLGTLGEKVCGPNEPRGKAWIAEQRGCLQRSQGEAVIEAIERLASRSNRARRAARVQVEYFTRDLERTRYLRFRRRGWPIGGGAIEGAGKHLITARFKGNGRRWKTASLHNLLALRVHVFNHPDHPTFALPNVA